MLKKSLEMTLGILIFVIGMVVFPLPLPLGLPIMLVGLTILFKSSYKIKRKVVRFSDKNTYTQKVWQQVKNFRRRKKTYD